MPFRYGKSDVSDQEIPFGNTPSAISKSRTYSLSITQLLLPFTVLLDTRGQRAAASLLKVHY